MISGLLRALRPLRRVSGFRVDFETKIDQNQVQIRNLDLKFWEISFSKKSRMNLHRKFNQTSKIINRPYEDLKNLTSKNLEIWRKIVQFWSKSGIFYQILGKNLLTRSRQSEIFESFWPGKNNDFVTGLQFRQNWTAKFSIIFRRFFTKKSEILMRI